MKTTATGLNGCFIDYAMITVGCDRGVIGMAKEHLTLAIALKIPIIVVTTKIDIAVEHKLKKIKLKCLQLNLEKKAPKSKKEL